MSLSDITSAGKHIGLYFSAHWCGPCRQFTPRLTEVYRKLTAEGKPFEVIFVSSDKDAKQFEEYFGEMPWLALPFSDRQRKDELSRFFNVGGIPSFVMISPDLKVLNPKARSNVASDPEVGRCAGHVCARNRNEIIVVEPGSLNLKAPPASDS